MQVSLTVNGEEVSQEIEGRLLLVHFLRDTLGLTGTHWGCDTSNCGTCVVWMDGEPVKSCTVLAAMAGGREVRTVEGLEQDGELDPVQQGFMECHGLQCGFCTPGMMMTARALLDRNPDPTEQEIREAISGQICRCTGYATIVRSIRWAATHESAVSRGEQVMTTTEERPTQFVDNDQNRSAMAGCCARRTRASSGAWATTATTSSFPACCTWPSCAPGGARPDRQGGHQRGGGPPQGQGGRDRRRPWPKSGLAWMPTLSNDVQAVLATDKVRFQGQEVAFVVAEDRYSARDALELIDVEYDIAAIR